MDEFSTIRALAETILSENIFRDGLDSGYTAPSGRMRAPWDNELHFLYPFQWLWDTFFIAGWSTNLEQGIVDVEKFLKSQRSDGMLGHIRYNREILARGHYFPPANIYYPEGKIPDDGEVTSKITQPPNVAYGAWELAIKLEMNKKRKFCESVFEKIFKYHQFIYECLSVDGLMVTIHPWQNGDDNSPKWDVVYARLRSNNLHREMTDWLFEMKIPYERVDVKLVDPAQRPFNSDYDIYLYLIYLYNSWGWNYRKIISQSPFRIVDPLSNSMLLRSNISLLEMAEFLNKNTEARVIRSWLEKTRKSFEKLFDTEREMYFAKDLTNEELIKISTVSSYVPLFSTCLSNERAGVIAKRLWKMQQDGRKLVPSTDFSESEFFDPKRYWRGPVWILLNTLIYLGLKHYKFDDVADTILKDTLSLVSDGKFFEYYDPENGIGLGSPFQSWSAASTLRLLQAK